MGVFYPQGEALEKYNTTQSEIDELAQEALDLASEEAKKLFPSFLWEVQMNEFDFDDYKLRGTCENAQVMEAYRLKRKYPNYWDYLDAMQVYAAYVEYIESAYGSFEMMKRASEEGYGTIYIPKRPKLTNKKKNRDFLWTGFLPSRVDPDFELADGAIEACLAMWPGFELDESDEVVMPKQEREIQERMVNSKERMDRVNSIYKSSSSGRYSGGIDAIVAFLNAANTGSIDNRQIKRASMSDIIDDIHEFDGVPPDLVESLLTPKNVGLVYDGMLKDRKSKEQLQILEALVSAGYDFLETDATRGMGKEGIRAITRKFGLKKNPADMTPEERKRWIKEQAKLKRNHYMRLSGDRRMAEALLLNRVQFSRAADSTGFRLSDVIPQDDD